MKAVTVGLLTGFLSVGVLSLAACSSGGGSGGAAVPAAPIDIQQLSANGFVQNKVLTEQEYYDAVNKYTSPASCGGAINYKAYNAGEQFIQSINSVSYVNNTSVVVQYTLNTTVASVSDKELNLARQFQDVSVAGYSGPVFQSNEVAVKCTIDANNNSRCDGAPKTTPEFNEYAKTIFPPDEGECHSEYDSKNDKAIYSQGTYTLANGSVVSALLIRKQENYTETCADGKAQAKIRTTVEVETNDVKSEDGEDCIYPRTRLFKSNVEQTADFHHVSESTISTSKAPLK